MMAEMVACSDCRRVINLGTEILRLGDGRIFCSYCWTEIALNEGG